MSHIQTNFDGKVGMIKYLLLIHQKKYEW